jgi:DNA replication protein DnaC
MAYSTEVVIKARERLAQAKADREAENQRHLIDAYQRVPRLKQIDLELRRTMAMAAQSVFSQGGDVRAAMERARNENLALQLERRELIAANFEEGYLDETPICDRCGGSGYVGSTMCECLTELCRQEQKKELSLLSGSKDRFEQFRLEYYSDGYDPKLGTSPRGVMEKNLKTCRSYAATFGIHSGNLLFVGGTGLGKTFLSACIARTVADRGYSVCYETASHLFANMERAKFSGDEEARREIEKYTACDLLIVDDLGTEMPGQFVTSALYSLLNDRILAGKPMVVSTNLNSDEAARRYSIQIASRLYGSFVLLPFVGKDIRMMKKT